MSISLRLAPRRNKNNDESPRGRHGDAEIMARNIGLHRADKKTEVIEAPSHDEEAIRDIISIIRLHTQMKAMCYFAEQAAYFGHL